MKKARLINLIVWAVTDIAICIGICFQWSAQGCGTKSLVLGVAYFTILTAGIGFVIDQTLKERNK